MSINIAAIVGLSFRYLAQPQPVLVQGEAAAILHGRRRVAARGDPCGAQILQLHLPEHIGHRRLVRVNRMGATLHELSHDWLQLWILVAVYTALTALSGWLPGRRSARLTNGQR
ncbi:hypothetical protein [Hyphomicrobium sp. DY-1]|uniref:hypothetical protein n=1 Tax=Hyphomicrobium sp. DY-1 TaxID=3075650 RepID=UPI0039C1C879